MDTTILVKSSSREEPYTVAVSLTNKGLSLFCNCPAGEWGKYCKHKMAVVLGDTQILYDEEQNENFDKIAKLVSESNYPVLVANLRSFEMELETIKKKIKKMKEQIASSMKDGLT